MSFIEIIESDESFELPIGDSVFTLRRFGSEVYKQVEKKHTKKDKNRRTGVIFTDPDEHAINEDLLDYMILDWQGIKSPTTKADVPCTRENKLKLPGGAKMQIIGACDADSVTGEQGKKESGTTS